MGNVLKICCAPTASDESPGHHGVSVGTVGVSALAQDLRRFEANSQVPEGLKNHVVSAKRAQANWYTKLSQAWKEAKPSPRTPEDASRLVFHTLRGHRRADVEGLLTFYGLPTTIGEEVKFELHTLPVDAEAVADGDTITVYVSTSDPRESSCVPRDVKEAAAQRSKAQANRNNREADALYRRITDSGYRVIPVQNKEVLARKYRIRLRGIDAPESSMPYGKEARDELVKLIQGKCLRVLVYTDDRYGRCIGDIYCNGILVQEMMLKKGLAWHYKAYDRQPELANWEAEARAKRIGLWASRNPEEPWVYRKNKRDGIKTSDEK